MKRKRSELKGTVSRDRDTLKVGVYPDELSLLNSRRKMYNATGVHINGDLRVLVIGDPHEPFTLDEYLEHCIKIYIKYNCNHVVFIGDIIDNHYSSYHETDPDGLGGKDELELAIQRVAKWVEAFPIADVCTGNHDLIIMRKAMSGGIPSQWIREFSDVLNAPNWTFDTDFEYDDVLYTHGTGRKAEARMKQDLTSVVCGHYHTEFYIKYLVGRNYRLFAMQVGCGIDYKAYALAYGRNFARPIIGCGVVLENGTLPILEPMKL